MNEQGIKLKNIALYFLFSFSIGVFIGAFVWVFFWLMDSGITLLWTVIPSCLPTGHWYTVLVCLAGGLIIGLEQKKYGEYPQSTETVMKTVKTEGSYPYSNMPLLFISALLPLLFGAAIGPEAGMTGAITALCYWAGRRFRIAGAELKTLTNMSIAASLSTIFSSPLFGLLDLVEPVNEFGEELVIPKKNRILVYITSVLGGMFAFVLFNSFLPAMGGMPSFESASTAGKNELIALIPIAIIGGACGALFPAAGKLARLLYKPVADKPVIKSLICGGIVALTMINLPILLFSGETQASVLQASAGEYTIVALFGLGLGKLVITNLCVEGGWRGGHIFPMIFAGVAIGLGCAGLFPAANSIFCIAAAGSALIGAVMRKPLAAAMLMLLCFPAHMILYLFAGALIGSCVPLLFDKKKT